MGAKFSVENYYNISDVCYVIVGRVESGEIIEGSIGMTSRGKKFTVVKIERRGCQISRARGQEKVNLSIKHLKRADLRSKDILYF